MLVTRSTHEILNNPWNDISPSVIVPSQLPKLYEKNLDFNDVVMWEEIFYQGGNIGVYAAWSPYAEFYIIVHNLFLKDQNLIEKFYGDNALHNLLKRLQEFEIEIPVKQKWTPNLIPT
jgi:hypothetical protein